jgi:hypothetical protein
MPDVATEFATSCPHCGAAVSYDRDDLDAHGLLTCSACDGPMIVKPEGGDDGAD